MWVFHIGFASLNLITREYVSLHKYTDIKQRSQSVPSTHTLDRRPRHKPRLRPRLLLPLWCGSTSSWRILEGRPECTKWFVVSRLNRESSQVTWRKTAFPSAGHSISEHCMKKHWGLSFFASIRSLAGLANVFLYLSEFCFSIHKAEMGQVRCLMFVAAGGEPGNQCGVGRMKWDNVC